MRINAISNSAIGHIPGWAVSADGLRDQLDHRRQRDQPRADGAGRRDQAASLEYQRRQAGFTVLAQFFNSLRQYRKRQGRAMLYMIQKWLGDGRLVRITTDNGNQQYVPLLAQADESRSNTT
jgi:hypothetical protein